MGLIFGNELLLDGKDFTFKNWLGFTTETVILKRGMIIFQKVWPL